MPKLYHRADEQREERDVVANAFGIRIATGEFEENRPRAAAEIVKGHRFLPLLSKALDEPVVGRGE